MHVRGDMLTVTIPAEILEEIAVHDGDELEVSKEGNRIVLTAKEELPERRKEIDAAIAQGLADVRAGRGSPPFKHMKEFEAWLKTKKGEKCGKE